MAVMAVMEGAAALPFASRRRGTFDKNMRAENQIFHQGKI
jgi:hypothetical protein